MLKKLRLKFVAVMMAIFTAMLGLVFGLVCHFTQAGLERESVGMMQSIAANPFQLGRPDDRSRQVRLPYFILQIGTGGEIVAAGGGYYDLSDQEFLGELIRACAEDGRPVGMIEEYSLRFCRVDAFNGWRLVFADVTSERATLRNLAETCAVIGVVSFAAFLGVSVLLAAWMVKPVDRAWEQQRRFVADASHELKTPLAVITTNAELLQGTDWDEGERARFSDSILTMSRRMRGLVERLLELAQADSGGGGAAFETVDCSALVERSLLPFEPLFFEQGLALDSEIEPGAAVRGSGSQLRQVVEILLDNARKYAGAEGRILVALKRTGRRHCRLPCPTRGSPCPKRSGRIFSSGSTGRTRPAAGTAASGWACPSPKASWSSTTAASGRRAGRPQHLLRGAAHRRAVTMGGAAKAVPPIVHRLAQSFSEWFQKQAV